MQQRPCLFFPMFVCLALAEWLVPCQGFVIVFTMVVFPKVFTESSCGTWGLGDPAHLASPISCHYPRRRCSSHPESALISPHLPDSLWPLGLVDAASSAWSSFSFITLGPWLWFYPLMEAFLGVITINSLFYNLKKILCTGDLQYSHKYSCNVKITCFRISFYYSTFNKGANPQSNCMPS